MSFKKDDSWTLVGLLFTLGLVLTSMAAWATHAIWIIKVLASTAGATAGQIVLGILGVVVPPIGVIHGILIWFS